MSEKFIAMAKDLKNNVEIIGSPIRINSYEGFIDYFNSVKNSYNQMSFFVSKEGSVSDVLFNYSNPTIIKETLLELKNTSGRLNRYKVDIDGIERNLYLKNNISDKIIKESEFIAVNKYEIIAIKEYFQKYDDLYEIYNSNSLFFIKLSSVIDLERTCTENTNNIVSISDCYLVSKKSLDKLLLACNKEYKNQIIRRKMIQNILSVETFNLTLNSL